MAWQKGQRIPTNLIIGFLGSGKTTAIGKLIDSRPTGEKWSIFINEYGMVSIDQAIVDAGSENIAVQELGGGCACCTMAFAFQPLLAQFIRRTRPDRLILEPSGASHPAKVIDVLRSSNFSSVIDLRNTICLIDPKDFDDPRWRETEVFQDQVQLADIVVVNWTDKRDRELIDRCRAWVESFAPQKLLITESSFGEIAPAWLDMDGSTARMPVFPDAHPVESNTADRPKTILGELPLLSIGSSRTSVTLECTLAGPAPGQPLRVPNDGPGHDACGWIFHVDDIFDRDRLLDLLGYVHPIVRLKGIFRCEDNWWSINRAKDTTSYAPSAYRRDSRLEVILDQPTSGWVEFEHKLLGCLLQSVAAGCREAF
jgi:G3E family GTPase